MTLRPELEAWRWLHAPATTIAADPRITAREHHYHGEQAKTSLRLTLEEAMTLQTYDFPYPGLYTYRNDILALDLFAGTGWGVACKRLGIEEYGIELMEEAVQTRTANGMKTILRDVWDGLMDGAEILLPEYNLLIASPPCQTFSMAGKGSGRKALDEVLEAITLEAYKRPGDLKEFGRRHDDRTALVLSPLAYVWRDRPAYVAFEQVPTVLPVWEACAEVMRGWGYSVRTEVLHAEQYGVPQTRKRAILVARLDGDVKLPTPTHSRYYSSNPKKLDPGVRKWVSMAEALGWSAPDNRIFCPTNLRPHSGFREGDHPASALAFGHDNPRWITEEELADYRENGTPQPGVKLDLEEISTLQTYPTGRGLTDRPAPTITGGGTDTGGAEPIAKYHERYTNSEDWIGSTDRLTTDEAATLQTYPSGVYVHPMTNGRRGIWPTDEPSPTIRGVNRPMPPGYEAHDRDACDPADAHKRLTEEEAATLQTYPSLRGGNQANSTVRDADSPAPTLHFGQRLNAVEWSDGEQISTDEAATLQTYPSWVNERPAPTVVGTRRSKDGMLIGRQLDDDSRQDVGGHQTGKGLQPGQLPGVRVSGGEAATLQTYERPFIWKGNKTKTFLQIGNAVPPLLAQHVLSALLDDTLDFL